MWRRTGNFVHCFSVCESIPAGLFIKCGVPVDGGYPLCLVMRHLTKGGRRVEQVWGDWQHRLLTCHLWQKIDGIWVVSGMPAYWGHDDIAGCTYYVRGAVAEAGGPPGVVLMRSYDGGSRRELVARWIDKGDSPEWLLPLTGGVEQCDLEGFMAEEMVIR